MIFVAMFDWGLGDFFGAWCDELGYDCVCRVTCDVRVIVRQVTWQGLVVGRAHAFGCCSLELRGEGGLVQVGVGGFWFEIWV